MITLRQASPTDAPAIARLITMAMTDECCLYYAGQGHTVDQFREAIERLARLDDSQYSYRNAILAVDDEQGSSAGGHANAAVAGLALSYDGAQLLTLRRPFEQEMMQRFGRDFSHMEPETEEGELYLDSLAVAPEYRRQGIAGRLLDATVEKARAMGISRVGLLVDDGNPRAERLYLAHGFSYAGPATWGGHRMKHLTTNPLILTATNSLF